MTPKQLIERLRERAAKRAAQTPAELASECHRADEEDRAGKRIRKRLKQVQFFSVRYAWTRCGVEFTGNTVETGTDQADAEARFKRKNPHVRILTGGAA